MGPGARILGTVPLTSHHCSWNIQNPQSTVTRGRPKNRAANSLHAWKTQNPRPSLTKYPTGLTHGGVALLIRQVSPAAITADRGSPQIPQPPIIATIEWGKRQNSSYGLTDHDGQ